jgi:hypothetical protein
MLGPSISQSPRWRRMAAVLSSMILAFVGAGCGKHSLATVKGKVMFGGQPVQQGMVYFVASDNATGRASLGDGGVYTMTDAPVGEVRIGVEVPPRPLPIDIPKVKPIGESPEHPMGGPPTLDPAKWTWIPDQFKDYSKSGLTWTVPTGGGEHDITLSP